MHFVQYCAERFVVQLDWSEHCSLAHVSVKHKALVDDIIFACCSAGLIYAETITVAFSAQLTSALQLFARG